MLLKPPNAHLNINTKINNNNNNNAGYKKTEHFVTF